MNSSEMIRDRMQGLSRNSPATDEAVKDVERVLGHTFPLDYVELLKISNGGEGMLGRNSYLALYPIEQIAAINEAAAVTEFAPGFIIFGSNGSGVSYAFDARDPAMPIVECDDMELSHAAAVRRGSSIVDFLEFLAEQ